MIVVRNRDEFETAGFRDLDAYARFAKDSQSNDRNCWDDEVWDVGEGGPCTPANKLDMTALHAAIAP
jgi:hypothetical protein